MTVPSFEIDLLAPGPPEEVWGRLWDLDRHTAAIPLTTVHGGTLGAGAGFTARTALGPVGFDDDMQVITWQPPRHAVIGKVGRVLRGRIEVVLRPAGPDTRLRWRQSFGVTGVPDAVARYAAPAVRAAYLSALRRLVRPEHPGRRTRPH